MFKKAMIAAAAALAVGGAMMATSADAQGRFGGPAFHGEGGRGEGFRGDGFRGEGFRGGPPYGFRGGYGWRAGPGFYADSCGWRWSPYLGRYVNRCW